MLRHDSLFILILHALYTFLNRPQHSHKDKAIFKLEGKSVSVGDIAGLSDEGIRVAAKGEKIAENVATKDLAGLFWLYEQKVGFSKEEMNAKYNSDKKTMLHHFIEKGHAEIAEFLIERGAYVSLHFALERGDKELLEASIDNGADINEKNKDGKGKTVLSLAIENDDNELIKLLVEKGANLNIKNIIVDPEIAKMVMLNRATGMKEGDYLGSTALHLAVRKNDEKLVEYLLEKGADINMKDDEKNTALHYAISGNNNKMFRLLLEKGADINIKNGLNQKPLDRVIFMGNLDIIKFMIGKNNNEEQKNSILVSAIEQGNEKLVNYMLENGAKVDMEDNIAKEAIERGFFTAVANGNKKMVERLIKQGVDINAKESDIGNTALHSAIEDESKEMVELLIEKGADINIRNDFEDKPIDIAKEYDFDDIVKVLQEAEEKQNKKKTSFVEKINIERGAKREEGIGL